MLKIKNKLIIACMLFFPFSLLQAKITSELTWTKENAKAIEHFLEKNHQNAIAVFDADKTLWGDDLGEAFFQWMIKEQKLLNIDYSQDIYAEYEKKLATNRQEGYTWIVRLMAGLKEEDLKQWAVEFFEYNFVEKIYLPQKTLISNLQKKGIDVWIVSASNRWVIEAGAAWLSVKPSHVLGIDLTVNNGILTDKIKEPVTYREGKILALKQHTHSPILFASGDSVGDQQLLEHASAFALLITHDRNQSDLMTSLALKHNWHVQYFPLYK